MANIRVLIADDSSLARGLLRCLLEAEPGIEVVGEACNGRQAVAMAIELEPDVVATVLALMDLAWKHACQHSDVNSNALEVPMTALLKATLRMRPDRILVGEVRGAEALDLLDAWNTGHEGGAATLHANNAAAGLARLRSLITRNESAPAEIEPLIGEVVHVVVHIARTPEGGRRIQEILEVSGYVDGRYITKTL